MAPPPSSTARAPSRRPSAMPRSPFNDCICTLISAWRNILKQLGRFGLDVERHNQLHQLIQQQTLPTMLMSEWATISPATRSCIRAQIEQCLPLVQKSTKIVQNCRYLMQIFEAPWAHPVLQRLMCEETSDDSATLAADIEYLTTDSACFNKLRLVALCNARLYPMVSALTGNLLRVLRSCHPTHPLRLGMQLEFVQDLHLIVLYRLGRFDPMLKILRAMDLPVADAYCSSPVPHQLPVHMHKYHERVKDTALPAFLTRFLPMDDARRSLADNVAIRKLCIEWVRRNATRATFAVDWQRLVDLGTGHRHFYRMLEVLTTVTDDAGDEHADAKLALLCRGIRYELKELVRLKTQAGCDVRTVLDTERQLAQRLDQLAVQFGDIRAVTRELMLTSFSLDPNQRRFNSLQQYAGEQRPNIQLFTTHSDLLSECPRHEAHGGPDNVLRAFIECPACGTRCVVRAKAGDSDNNDPRDSDQYNVAPNLILDEMKRSAVPHAVRKDLLKLISAPRIKCLSWLMEWPELRLNCLELLDGQTRSRRGEADNQRNRHLPAQENPAVSKKERGTNSTTLSASNNGYGEGSVSTCAASNSTQTTKNIPASFMPTRVANRRQSLWPPVSFKSKRAATRRQSLWVPTDTRTIPNPHVDNENSAPTAIVSTAIYKADEAVPLMEKPVHLNPPATVNSCIKDEAMKMPTLYCRVQFNKLHPHVVGDLTRGPQRKLRVKPRRQSSLPSVIVSLISSSSDETDDD